MLENSQFPGDMKAYCTVWVFTDHSTFLNKKKTSELSKSFGIPAIASAEIDKIVRPLILQ